MFCLTKDNLAWIKIAKNACTSWEVALSNDGWKLENLSDYQGRWQEKTWFGFLRDPDVRHTMGVVQFLCQTNLLSIIDDEKYSKVVCSLLFDEHTYSIHHLVPYELIKITNWFIIDHKCFNYETLTRNFCQQYGVSIPAIPKLNQSNAINKSYRDKITKIKENNPTICAKAQKNYLERDVFLYANATQEQSKYDI